MNKAPYFDKIVEMLSKNFDEHELNTIFDTWSIEDWLNALEQVNQNEPENS